MELDQTNVWITTRRLRPGTRDEFSRAWRPSEFPEGMLRAYECYSPDGNEVVGISIWDSLESRERFRLSEVESKRRQAMAPFLIDERSGFYLGRELKIPSVARPLFSTEDVDPYHALRNRCRGPPVADRPV